MATFTNTISNTFTLTHAKHLASKIAADMHIFGNYYGKPCEADIQYYSEELAILLNGDYVSEYEFGFEKSGFRIISLRYVIQNGIIHTDDRAGKIYPYADVKGAIFYNFLTYGQEWFKLSASEKLAVQGQLPFSRGGGELPSNGIGSWSSDKTYSAGGTGLSRGVFKSW